MTTNKGIRMVTTYKDNKEVIRCTNDKEYFFNNYFFILCHHDGFTNNAKMYPLQSKIQNFIDNNTNSLIIAPRQLCGTSTMIMFNMLHDLIFEDNVVIRLGTFKHVASRDMTRSLMKSLDKLPSFMHSGIKYNKANQTIEVNGNRLEMFNDSVTLGESITPKYKIYLDNCSLLDKYKIDDKICQIETIKCLTEVEVVCIDTGLNSYLTNFTNFISDKAYRKLHVTTKDVFPSTRDFMEFKVDKLEFLGKSAWHDEYEPLWTFA